MLECNNLSLKYDDDIIFEGLGITLFPGSALHLVGKNGSGKTSLLKAIAGLKKPEIGEVYRNKINIYESNEDYFHKVNYIGTKAGFKEELTVLENLEFHADLNYVPELLLASISYFRLGDYADYRAGRLSAGLRKKLSLSRLMCSYADIWLLDEPETSLDADGVLRLKNLFDSKLSNGGIIIYASHSNFYQNCIEINLEDYKKI